jgi:hypothetical protein
MSRLFAAALAFPFFAVACSSSSNTGPSAPRQDPASVTQPTQPDDAGGGEDAAVAADGGSDARAGRGGVGVCASCTAQKCMKELQACGGSQGCLGALKEFNDCYGASSNGSAACGADFAKQSAQAKALWDCLMRSCPDDCS